MSINCEYLKRYSQKHFYTPCAPRGDFELCIANMNVSVYRFLARNSNANILRFFFVVFSFAFEFIFRECYLCRCKLFALNYKIWCAAFFAYFF